MSRRTRINVVWLTLSGLLIAAGLNVALRERPFVSILIAFVFVGGSAAMLLPAGVAVYNDPDPAEALADLRKDFNR